MKDKIKEECMKNPTEESCGLLLFEKKRTKIIPCQNYAENKKQNFKISFKDFISAEKKGEVFGIYHSHVDDSYEFSASSKYKSKSFKNFLSRVRKVYGVK